MANKVGIRDTLMNLYSKKYGFTNDDIGMDDNRNVTIKGQKLMNVMPSSIKGGRSYADQSRVDRNMLELAKNQGWGEQTQSIEKPISAGQALANNSMNKNTGFNNVITNEKLDSMLNNILNFKYDPTTDPSYQVAQTEGNKLFKNQMGDYSAMTMGNPSSWGMAAASQSQNEYTQRALAQGEQNARNRAVDNFKTAYGLYRDNVADQRYYDELAYNRGRTALNDEVSTVGQYASNYQAEIDRRTATPDTEDDKLIPYIRTAREGKLQDMRNKDIANVGQYYDNFQAEIDKRTNTPDASDDFLIPYLRTARQQKIEGKKKEDLMLEDRQLSKEDRLFEQNYKNRQLSQQDRQLNISQQNANTSSYNSTKSGGLTKTETKNQGIADDISDIQNLSVSDAIRHLEDYADEYISAYGISGYKQIWNGALAKAIKAGQAKRYDDYYKAPKSDNDLTSAIEKMLKGG